MNKRKFFRCPSWQHKNRAVSKDNDDSKYSDETGSEILNTASTISVQEIEKTTRPRLKRLLTKLRP